MASSAKLAPRIEIYTHLACVDLIPGIPAGQGLSNHFGLGYASSFPSDFSVSTAVRTDYTPLDSSIESSRESVTAKPFNTDACASDPVVQAAVAKLIAGLACLPSILQTCA